MFSWVRQRLHRRHHFEFKVVMDGKEIWVCRCGKEEQKGHNCTPYLRVIGSDAENCADRLICDRCGKLDKRPHEHRWVFVRFDAEKCVDTLMCDRCYKPDERPHKHHWVFIEYDAGSDVDRFRCDRCEKLDERLHEHHWVLEEEEEFEYPYTYTDPGLGQVVHFRLNQYKCARCRESKEETERLGGPY